MLDTGDVLFPILECLILSGKTVQKGQFSGKGSFI